MKFKNIHNQLQYIASKGNDADMINALTIIHAYTKSYGQGLTPSLQVVRGGKEASAIANLRSMFTGPTKDVNALIDLNRSRVNFLSYISTVNPTLIQRIPTELLNRSGLVKGVPFPGGYPLDVKDCQGNILGSAATPLEYVAIWNTLKVPADLALCGKRIEYLYESGFEQHFGLSFVQPENVVIPKDAPAVVGTTKNSNFKFNAKTIVRSEAESNPTSLSKFSKSNI